MVYFLAPTEWLTTFTSPGEFFTDTRHICGTTHICRQTLIHIKEKELNLFKTLKIEECACIHRPSFSTLPTTVTSARHLSEDTGVHVSSLACAQSCASRHIHSWTHTNRTVAAPCSTPSTIPHSHTFHSALQHCWPLTFFL